MRISISLLLLLGYQLVFAQIDSVQLERDLIAASDLVNAGQYEEGIEKAKVLIKIGKENKLPSLVAKASMVAGHGSGYSGNWEQALFFATQYKNNITDKNQKDYVDAIYDIGYIYDWLENRDSTLHYYLSSIEGYKALDKMYYTDIGLVHHNISYNFRNYGDLENALYHAQQATENWNKMETPIQSYTLAANNNLGYIYMELNDYELSKTYFEKYRTISEEAEGRDSKSYAAGLALLAQNANAQNDMQAAINYSLEAISILEKKSTEKVRSSLSTYHNNLGLIYFELKEYEKAEASFLKSLDYSEDNFLSMVNLTSLYLNPHFKDIDRAYSVIDRAAQRAVELDFKNDFYIKSYKAQVLVRKHRYQEGLQLFNEMLSKDVGTAIIKNWDGDKIPSLDAIPNNRKTRGIFKARMELYKMLYEETKELKYLKQAYEHGLFAIKIFEAAYQLTPYVQNSRSKETKVVYEIFLDIGWLLYTETGDKTYIDQTFQFSEQLKGNEILSGLNTPYANKYLPRELVEKEKKIKLNLTDYKSKFFEAQSVNDEEAAELQKKVTYWQQKYEAFMVRLQKEYPNYYNLKYETGKISIGKLRKELIGKDDILIEYFMGKEALYYWVLGQSTMELFKVENVEEVKQLITDLRNNITDVKGRLEQPKTAYDDYVKVAGQLYDLLLKRGWQGTSNMLIVPDAELNYLPFEVLLTEQTTSKKINYQTLPYLITQTAVSYGYAAKLLLKKQKRQHRNFLATFSPTYQTLAKKDTTNNKMLSTLMRNGNTYLPGAQKEAETIAKMFDGDWLKGDAATEATFKSISRDYQILHLSMHALVNEQFPMQSHLLFQGVSEKDDGLLRIGEVYNMDIPANLVVLSACNSGFGKVRRGDGVASLATAFNYAGTTSTVMSLWKVPDQSTAPLMIGFYEALKAKTNKNNALQQSKLDYINTAMTPDLAHPFYWAGFIASGDRTPLYQSSFSWLWLVGIALLGLWVIGFIYRKRITVL